MNGIHVRSPRGVSDHQCRAAALRLIVAHAALRVTNQVAYDTTMRVYVERWRHYDARIAARQALK